MKLKILLFLFISIFLIASAALAMPKVMEIATVSEPYVMLISGTFFIWLSVLMRKLFLSEKVRIKR